MALQLFIHSVYNKLLDSIDRKTFKSKQVENINTKFIPTEKISQNNFCEIELKLLFGQKI